MSALGRTGLGLQLLLALGILWGTLRMVACNEDRALRSAAGFARGPSDVVTVPADVVNPANEGRLVHLQGQAAVDRPLVDEALGIEAEALRLERRVEMYQWKDEGSGKASRYRPTWTEERLHLNSDGRPREFTNPEFPLRNQEFNAHTMRVGAFSLDLVPYALEGQPLTLQVDALDKVSQAWKPRARIMNGALYWGDPKTPSVGDLRITYRQVLPATVTVLGRQEGSTLRPYSSAGILVALWGSHTPEALFRQERQNERAAIAMVRVFLTGFALVGVTLLFLPMRALARVAPAIDPLVGPGFFVFVPLVTTAILTGRIGWAWRTADVSFGHLLLGIALATLATLVVIGVWRKERLGL